MYGLTYFTISVGYHHNPVVNIFILGFMLERERYIYIYRYFFLWSVNELSTEGHHLAWSFMSKPTIFISGQQDVSLPSQRCGAMFGNGLAGDCVARWVGKNGSMFNQQGVVKHGGLTRKKCAKLWWSYHWHSWRMVVFSWNMVEHGGLNMNNFNLTNANRT